MFRFVAVSGTLIAALSVRWTAQLIPGTTRAAAAPAVNCAAVTFTLHPGLRYPPRKEYFPPAPDAPRGPYTVSLPLYPGAVPLRHDVATPYPEYPGDPYLQTASAEYEGIDTGAGDVRQWLAAAFIGCGWHRNGFWSGNTPGFSDGITFTSNTNPKLSVEVSFGDANSQGIYFGYGIEEIIYPHRPAPTYLHGPFVQIRITQRRYPIENGQIPQPYYVHATVVDRPTIRRLVAAINGLKDWRTVVPRCHGLGFKEPIWLDFVRGDGSIVSAYETMWGPCNGLAVNRIGWLIDTGIVWHQARALLGGRG